MYALNTSPPGTIYKGLPPPDPTRRAFVPNQIVLYVEHTSPLTRSTLQALIAETNKTPGTKRYSTIQEIKKGDKTYDFPMPVVSFPDNINPQFSLVIATLSKKTSDEDLLRFVLTINKNLRRVEERQQRKPTDAKKGRARKPWTLKAAAPDWLNGGTQSGGSPTGGPGGKPVQATNPRDIVRYEKWKIKPAAHQDAGQGVNVAILDTLPCLQKLAQIYYLEHKKKWRWPSAGHPLVMKLLDPHGPVKFYPASYADLAEIAGYRIECHEYPVADHGLFIAGLINDIAPRAKLHLIQVLNEYGVGNSSSLAHGLATLTQLITNPKIKGRWVVNCSFMLDVPNCGHEDLLKFFPQINEVKQWLKHCQKNPQPEGPHPDLDDMLKPIKAMCEFLAQLNNGQDVCVVAAAGNDWGKPDAENDCQCERDSERPYARFPAAFAEVIGVAALNRNNKPANYSNLADRPTNVGYMALGGEEGENKGVLGMYLEDFPLQRDPNGAFNFEVNTSGWGWWAGTSFAAPMISGLAAAILGSPIASSGSTTQTAKTSVTTGLVSHVTAREPYTNEEKIFITQG